LKIGIETQVGNIIEKNNFSHTTMTFRRTLAANLLVKCQMARMYSRNISLAPFAPVQPPNPIAMLWTRASSFTVALLSLNPQVKTLSLVVGQLSISDY
jgi:hypothetical protein